MNEANFITAGIGISSIVILLTVKEVIEPKLKEKFNLKLPIPIDIVVVSFHVVNCVKFRL